MNAQEFFASWTPSVFQSRSLSAFEARQGEWILDGDLEYRRHEFRRLRRRAVNWIYVHAGLDTGEDVATPLFLARRLFGEVRNGVPELASGGAFIIGPNRVVLKFGSTSAEMQQDLAWACGALAVGALQLWCGSWEKTRELEHAIGAELERMWREDREVTS